MQSIQLYMSVRL